MIERKRKGFAAAALTLLALPAQAQASATQESIFQDDPGIVYPASEQALDSMLARIKGLGADRIRATLLWNTVAPKPKSEHRPRFGKGGAAWPDAYPPGSWDRYDRIVRLAKKHGLGVLFNITGGGPAWATRGRHGLRDGVFRPSAKEFGLFVRAAGHRYSGNWPDRARTPRQPPPGHAVDVPGTGIGIGEEPSPPPPPTPSIPRVDHWSIWNEPNFPSWLLPQWEPAGRSWRAVTPHLYRRLVDAAWRNLIASSHGVDVILLGETAPYGPKDPRKPGTNGLLSAVNFVKELYCLRRSYRPYKGQPARARNCPATAAERRGFRRAHPGLFAATGWAHHPYSLENRPTWRGRRRDASPLGAIGRLTRALDRAQFHWGAEGQMDVWITEYGYQTQPPDPYRGVPWSRQAAWMSWAEFLAWRNPRVASFSQFLLHDDAPDARYSRRSPKYWVTWQSGLLTHRGRRKPALAEYARPIHVTPRRARRGRKVRVFSTYRPAADRTPMRAYILFRPRGGEWRILRNVRVTNLRGYLNAFVRSPGRGRLRVVWAVPGVGYKASRGVLIGR